MNLASFRRPLVNLPVRPFLSFKSLGLAAAFCLLQVPFTAWSYPASPTGSSGQAPASASGAPSGAPAGAVTPSGSSVIPQAATAQTNSSRQAPSRTGSKGSSTAKAAAPPLARVIDWSGDTIVVVATRTPEPVESTASSVSVITRQQMDDQHETRLVDALQTLPGIVVGDYGGPGQTLSLFSRGAASDQMLFTVDGRRQPLDSTNEFDFSNIFLEDVSQIELDQTPTSTLFGENGVGGTLNLVTLSGRGLKTPESDLFFEAGAFDTFHEIVQSRGSSGAFDYAVSLGREDASTDRPNPQSQSYNTFVPSPLVTTYRDDTYRGNFGYQIVPQVYADLQTSYYHVNAGSPGDTEEGGQMPDARLVTENWNISPRITAQLSDYDRLSTLYNFTELDRMAAYPDSEYGFNPGGFGTQSKSEVSTQSFDLQNDAQITRNWLLTAGVQSDQTRINEFSQIDQADPTEGFPSTAGQQIVGATLSNVGGYLQSQWDPIARLHVIDSVRYDAYSQFAGAWSWRQGVAYRFAPHQLLLHASVATAYSVPSADDLFYPGFYSYDNNGNVILAGQGNPNLKPVTSLSWELGAEQPLWIDGSTGQERLTLTATYFHTKEHGAIESPEPYYFPVNAGDATSDGCELGFKCEPISTLALDCNYTYLNAVNNTNEQEPLQPHHTLNLVTDWKPVPPLTFTLSGHWVFDRTYSVTDYNSGLTYSIPAEDYATVNLSGSCRITKQVTVWARGENVFNERYSVYQGYPALGAAAYGGIKVTF